MEELMEDRSMTANIEGWMKFLARKLDGPKETRILLDDLKGRIRACFEPKDPKDTNLHRDMFTDILKKSDSYGRISDKERSALWSDKKERPDLKTAIMNGYSKLDKERQRTFLELIGHMDIWAWDSGSESIHGIRDLFNSLESGEI
jgi:hypothetical protein